MSEAEERHSALLLIRCNSGLCKDRGGLYGGGFGGGGGGNLNGNTINGGGAGANGITNRGSP